MMGLLTQLRDETTGHHRGIESVLVIEAFSPHVFHEGAAVRCEATNGGCDVVVHSKDLFRGRWELVGGALEATEDNLGQIKM
jgi:hypothetical protein